MKLVILSILFVLFLLSLVKLNYKEHFDSSIELKNTDIPFKNINCKNVFKSDQSVNNYLKKIDPNIEKSRTLEEFIPILFLITHNLTKELSETFETLINSKNILVKYYNDLIKDGKITEFPDMKFDNIDDNSDLKYTDLEVMVSGNIFSFENYVDDITVTVTGSNIKLSGTGYASLKSDIKEAYKVKEVSDNILLLAMFNNFVLIYNKCVSLKKSINEKISLVKNNTEVIESFTENKLKTIKITTKNKEFKTNEKYNAKLVIKIWKDLCSIVNNYDFDVEKIDEEIKNLVI